MEWGYLGGTVWAALFFAGVGMAIARLRRHRSWNNELRLLSWACVLSICGLLLHGLVDFPLQIPSLQLYAAVLLGFLWNLSEPRRRRKRISQKADSARGDFGNGWTPLASKDASRISTGFFSKEGHLI